MARREQTWNEEIANSITHGIGILFCLVAVPLLLFYAYRLGTANTLWAVSIFGFGMLMVYTSSTLYHWSRNADTKKTLRIWDHVSIFLLIAGSYTPVVQKYTPASTATWFLTVMWGIVAVGSFLKIFYTGRFEILSLLLYLGLGWMAVFLFKPLFNNIPWSVLYWIIAGGACYTLGVVFYKWKSLQYHHAIWHCFVLAGTVTHYVAVFKSTLTPDNII